MHGRCRKARPCPDYLSELQGIAGTLAGVEPAELSEVLVTEYPVGATIGWHRDAAPFGIVVGVSLLSACRFRFRRTVNDRVERAETGARAPIGVRPERPRAHGMAAQHPADNGVALLDYVQDVAAGGRRPAGNDRSR